VSQRPLSAETELNTTVLTLTVLTELNTTVLTLTIGCSKHKKVARHVWNAHPSYWGSVPIGLTFTGTGLPKCWTVR